jgi:hypothetical protein
MSGEGTFCDRPEKDQRPDFIWAKEKIVQWEEYRAYQCSALARIRFRDARMLLALSI